MPLLQWQSHRRTEQSVVCSCSCTNEDVNHDEMNNDKASTLFHKELIKMATKCQFQLNWNYLKLKDLHDCTIPFYIFSYIMRDDWLTGLLSFLFPSLAFSYISSERCVEMLCRFWLLIECGILLCDDVERNQFTYIFAKWFRF